MTFDLVVLLTVELAAIFYAGSLLYERRPQFLVFAIDRFQVVEADRVAPYPFRYEELSSASWSGPRLVAARFPADTEERAALRRGIFFDGDADIDLRPDHWYPYATAVPDVLGAALELSEFARRGDMQRAATDDWLASRPNDVTEFLTLPLAGKIGNATAVIEKATGLPVGMLPVDPWPPSTP